MGRHPSWLLPSAWLQGRSSLLLGMDMCTHPFPDEFQGPLVLRDLEWLHGPQLIGDKTTQLSDHLPHELGMLGEACSCSWSPQGPR